MSGSGTITSVTATSTSNTVSTAEVQPQMFEINRQDTPPNLTQTVPRNVYNNCTFHCQTFNN